MSLRTLMQAGPAKANDLFVTENASNIGPISLDEADRVLRSDVFIQRFRQQRLGSVVTCEVRHNRDSDASAIDSEPLWTRFHTVRNNYAPSKNYVIISRNLTPQESCLRAARTSHHKLAMFSAAGAVITRCSELRGGVLDAIDHIGAKRDGVGPAPGRGSVTSIDDQIVPIYETGSITRKIKAAARNIIGHTSARDRLQTDEQFLDYVRDPVGRRSFDTGTLAKNAGYDRTGRDAVDPHAVLPEFRSR
jgi:hypothetical protein